MITTLKIIGMFAYIACIAAARLQDRETNKIDGGTTSLTQQTSLGVTSYSFKHYNEALNGHRL